MGMLKQAQGGDSAKKSPVADAGSDDPTPATPPQPQGAVPGQPANDGSQQGEMDQSEQDDQEDQQDGGTDESQESDPDSDGDDDSSAQGDTDDDSGGGDGMSPQEDQELKKAALALHTVLFQNQGTGQAIVGMLQPAAKVDSTSKAGILLFKEMDKKLNLNNDIVPAFALIVADQLTDMGEKVKGIQYSDQELQAVTGAIIEGAIHVVGMSPEEAKQRLAAYSPQEQQKAKSDYQNILSSAQGDSPQGAAPDQSGAAPDQGGGAAPDQGGGAAPDQGAAAPGQSGAAPDQQQDPQAGGQ